MALDDFLRGLPPRPNPDGAAARIVVTDRARAALGDRLDGVLAAALAARARYEARKGGLAGWCQTISNEAVDALDKAGMGGRIVFGRVRVNARKNPEHFWFEVEGVWVDASGDQFDPRGSTFPAVSVAMPDEMPRHALTRYTRTPWQMIMGPKLRPEN